MELLPPQEPKEEPEEILANPVRKPRLSKGQRIAAFTVSGAACFGFVLWGVNQFLSLRGVIHVFASRIVLGLTTLVAILGVFLFTRLLARWRKTFFGASTVIIVLFAVLLDWWAPKPKEVPNPDPQPKEGAPVSLSMGCTSENIPLHIPANTTIHIMRINPSLRGNPTIPDIGVFHEISSGEKPIDWPSKREGRWMTPSEKQAVFQTLRQFATPWARKCEITSYGNATLEETDAYLLVDMPDKQRHGYRIPFNPLIFGKTFTFYMINTCSSGIVPLFMQWADQATVRVVGEETERRVPLQFEKTNWPSQLQVPMGASAFLWNDVPSCEGW
jgi:hypothetical protein